MLTLEDQNRLRQDFQRQFPDWLPATERYAALACQHMKPGGFTLDLGCGRGGLVEQAGVAGKHIYGVDPDFDSLREHRMPAFPRAAAVPSRLPFPDAYFDLILGSWTLEHSVYPQGDFGEIGRILQPGGAFVFITPNKRHPLIKLNQLLSKKEGLPQRLIKRFYGREEADTFPAHYLANQLSDLLALGNGAGLRLDILHRVADPSYYGFAPKLYPILTELDGLLPAERQLHLVGCFRKRL